MMSAIPNRMMPKLPTINSITSLSDCIVLTLMIPSHASPGGKVNDLNSVFLGHGSGLYCPRSAWSWRCEYSLQ